MSTVNDSDLFLVNRGGASFRVTADNLDTLQDDDLLLVQRSGQSFKCRYADRNDIQDTDLLLVNRGGASFSVAWSDVKGQIIFQIGRALRFRGTNQFLEVSSSLGSAENNQTLSLWFRRTDPESTNDGANYIANNTQGGGGTGTCELSYTCSSNMANDGPIQLAKVSSSATSTARFRDYSAWYHLVYQSISGNSSKVFINNEEILSANQFQGLISGLLRFGQFNNSGFFNGYMAEIYGVDGQALAPTSFGEYNDNGVWVPIAYTGTYGTNGFHLDFSDPADLGNDSSGNNNDFDANNFNTTSTSVDFDSVTDSPTVNFATLSPLGYLEGNTGTNPQPKFGNLTMDISSNPDIGMTYFFIPRTGKYYFEILPPSNSGESGLRLYMPATTNTSANGVNAVADILSQNTGGFNRYAMTANSGASTDLTPNGTVNKTTGSASMQVAIDADNNRIYIGDGNTNQWLRNSSGTYTLGAFSAANPAIDYSSLISEQPEGQAQLAFNGTDETSFKFGQQPFSFTLPDGYSTDTTFKSAGLPSATILNGTDHFRALTGDGANILAIAQGTNTTGTNWNDNVNTGFANAFYWIKRLAGSNQHQLFNSMNGTTSPNVRDSPQGAGGAYVAPAGNSVAYCWSAPDAMPQATREAGDIDVTSGRTNVTAGFSMINYTGNGNSNQSIAHGLGTQPDFVIAGCRRTTEEINTSIWNSTLNSSNSVNRLVLETDNLVQTSDPNCWGTDFPDNQFFYVGSDSFCNKNSTDYTMYLWTTIVGYSQFGTFRGNSSQNGPFVYTGFRPAWVLIKNTSRTANWILGDSTQQAFNPVDTWIFPSTTGGATQQNNNDVDLLSNGFKLRGTDQQTNDDNRIYLYAAFAQYPFGGSNAVPAVAR